MSKSTKVVAAVKTPKITLNSIVLAVAPVLPTLKEGDTHSPEVLAQFDADVAAFVNTQAQALADYLVDKSDNVEIISRLLSATVTLIPAVLEREAENIAKRKADREANRSAARAAKEAENAAAAAALEEEKQKMLKLLVDSGMDLTVAKAAVEAGVKEKLKASRAAVNSYERVTVEVDGKQYEFPKKGNMSQELKDLFAASGEETREAFIAKYAVTATESEEAGE